MINVTLYVLLLVPYIVGLVTLIERKKILNMIGEYVTDAVYQMLNEQMEMWLVKEPDKTAKAIEPLMSKVVDDLIKRYQQNPEKFTNEPVIKTPFGKIPMSLIMQFLGKGAAQKAEELNPFG